MIDLHSDILIRHGIRMSVIAEIESADRVVPYKPTTYE
jgi:hypothetical protein